MTNRLSALCLAAVLAGAAALPSEAPAWPQPEQSAPGLPGLQPQAPAWQGQSGMQPAMAGPLDGVWTSQTPQGPRTFRFAGNRYVQAIGGRMLDEGVFQVFPDGRFQYQVTGGPYAGQSGENRIACDGRTLTMLWPDGTSASFLREGAAASGGQGPQWGSPAPAPGNAGGWGQPMPAATPLEGRWVWAKPGQASFGFVFSGNRFESFWNGQTTATGTFDLHGPLLVMRHETGPDAGRVDNLGCQISGNRMVLHVGQNPDDNPIPFVRQ